LVFENHEFSKNNGVEIVLYVDCTLEYANLDTFMANCVQNPNASNVHQQGLPKINGDSSQVSWLTSTNIKLANK